MTDTKPDLKPNERKVLDALVALGEAKILATILGALVFAALQGGSYQGGEPESFRSAQRSRPDIGSGLDRTLMAGVRLARDAEPPGLEEFVKRSDVQDNAIVKIRFQIQVRHPTQFVLEIPEFGEEVLLMFDFLGEQLGSLPRCADCGLLAFKRFKSTEFQPYFWLNVAQDRLEKSVFVEPMVVHPDGIVSFG